MTTFSQLVDKMIRETHRPDMAPEIASYLNQVIREVHFDPQTNNVVIYSENYKEQQLVATVESGMTWSIPNPANFQAILGVKFARCDRWAKQVTPGPRIQLEDYCWYRGGSMLAFGGRLGYGGIGAAIQLAWYEYPRGLKYFPLVNRPAEYDPDSGWTYAPTYDVDEVTRLQAREMVSNWLLMRWDTVLEEGLRAKIYKRTSDTERQRTSYSLYMQLRRGLYTSEVADVSQYIS